MYKGIRFYAAYFCFTILGGIPAVSASEMTFELKGMGNLFEWVSAEGEITRDTLGRFEAFVAQEDKGHRGHIEFNVAFNSPGGSLTARH